LNASSGACTMTPVTHNIEIFESPVVDFSGQIAGCTPLSAQLKNLSPDPTNVYFWMIGNASNFNTTDVATMLATPGEYDVTLTATSARGCKSTIVKPKFLTVYPMPVADFTTNPPKATIEAPVIYFANNSTNADSYFWILGDSTNSIDENVTHNYPKTGKYDITLIAMNAHGCVDTSYGSIEISEGFSFYIPNAFTPDGDGQNDFFQGYGSNLKTYSMMIYNRWGEKIYQTSEYTKPWNGREHNNAVEQGVYVYRVVITDETDQEHEYVGSVSVVR
jgi:gliding motility-associated-like protein